MVAQVVSFFSRVRATPDWSQQELAEFYRVEAALIQAGIQVETDRGLSDEGDPWFVFCRAEDGEVVIHFARFDGQYVIAGPAYEGIARGHDFGALTRDLISRHPLVQPRGPAKKTNVVLHPAAFLIAIVGTAFFKSGEARASERTDKPADEPARQKLTLNLPTPAAPTATINIDAQQALTILTSAMIATVWRDRAFAEQRDHRPATLEWGSSPLDPDTDTRSLTGHAISAPLAAATPLGSSALTPEAAAEAKALFAIIALLSDLSAPGAPPPPDPAAAAPAGPPPSGDLAPDTPGGFEIAIVTNATKGLSAFELIRDTNLISELGAGDVAYLSALPRLLAELIEQGIRARVENDGSVDLDAPGPAPEFLPLAIVDDSSLIPPLPVSPDPVSPGPETGPTLTQLPGVMAPNAAIGEVIDHFVAHTQQIEVMVVDDQIVIYDVRLTTNSHAQASFQSITFDFDDGSSISLIGAVSAITGYDLIG
ncbi:hypothetical protein [uncultured Phenylobacterium sp.]|uniref:hypothetical protein n=1 Tax=uncultured Phenylobacterium sp. TaxID=349273 RepID=UPI0025E9FF82|nr:hypothetical protein [uncultured Phenylobacterium sp.]